MALRQRFELFLSRYEVGRVSFNFLPELLHAAMRQALGLDDELARLRERIRGLSARIQEDQAERANALLGLVSALGTLSGAGAAFTVLKEGQEALGWRPGTFWTLFGLLVLVAVLAVATYMFPHHRRKLLKRWRRST